MYGFVKARPVHVSSIRTSPKLLASVAVAELSVAEIYRPRASAACFCRLPCNSPLLVVVAAQWSCQRDRKKTEENRSERVKRGQRRLVVTGVLVWPKLLLIVYCPELLQVFLWWQTASGRHGFFEARCPSQ